jgi:hypothetical protein
LLALSVLATVITMKLRPIAEECTKGTCPTVYLADNGNLVVQGKAVRTAEGLRLGPGELAVELPIRLAREAWGALDR